LLQLASEIGDVPLVNVYLARKEVGLLVVDFYQIASDGYFNIKVFYLGKYRLFLFGVSEK
jgi:hypothetical protein